MVLDTLINTTQKPMFAATTRDLLHTLSHRRDTIYHGPLTSVVEHWLEQEIVQWVHQKGLIL